MQKLQEKFEEHFVNIDAFRIALLFGYLHILGCNHHVTMQSYHTIIHYIPPHLCHHASTLRTPPGQRAQK